MTLLQGKISSMNTTSDYYNIHTLNSMQSDSNVLPIKSSTSSNSNIILSYPSKSHKSLYHRLKRFMNLPPTKISADYQLLKLNDSNSSILSSQNPIILTKINKSNEIKRTVLPSIQHVPFLYGLKNCGNTCYINAIIQCLCHTEPLALYILRKTYENDIRNIKNTINDNKNLFQYSNNFKVTKIFIQIFQTLWNNTSNITSKLLYDFKIIISNLNKQYSGNEQNDAQEFLLFLINTIHDELNLANSKRYQQENKNSLSSSELARRAWLEYINVNQSIITSTFSGQLHSILHCNQCKQESKTFEPYLLLSLPIPQKIIQPVFITVVFLNQSPKQLQIGLCLSITNTVKDVRDAIAQQSNLNTNDLVLMEIQEENGFSQVFHDNEPITRLKHDIYAIQFPSSNSDSNEHLLPITENFSTSYVNLLILNRVRHNSGQIEQFGAPIVIRVPQQSDYRLLQLSIIKAQRSFIRDEAIEYAKERILFQLTLHDQYQTISSEKFKQDYPILHNIQYPLYLEKIREILETYNESGLGPSHIQLYANWHEKYLEKFVSKRSYNDNKPDIHQSVAQARAKLRQSSIISLADCFSLFTQSESLNYDDAWMCTHCRRKENGTVKNLKIWTIPSILIIHLKRFCQTKISNTKLTYPVQFPLVNFNVKQFLSTTENILDNNQMNEDNSLYDLFAVCNHRGSMSSGHYTAYCKNPITDKWFCYDDHLVSEIDPSTVCTPEAYILFYKRRDISLSQNEFNELLNISHSSLLEDKKFHNTTLPPLPLPRKLLTSPSRPDECSLPPCPMPRTRIPKHETKITSQPIPPIRRQGNNSNSHYLSKQNQTLNDLNTNNKSYELFL